jgi:UDP:flavonoid glycosyltransferase YjiC (YdhE family)
MTIRRVQDAGHESSVRTVTPNAARIELLGAGSTVSMDADAERMRKAVADLLADCGTRAAAGRLAPIFVRYRGADAAVDGLEELVAS